MDLLRAYAVPLQYGDYSEGVEDFRITNTATGKEYRTEIVPANRIVGDIGVFAKLPSSSSPNKSVYLVNGIQTFGVLGAARSFIDEEYRHRNLQIVRSVAGERQEFFLAILRLPVIEGIAYPAEVDVSDLWFFRSLDRAFEPAR